MFKEANIRVIDADIIARQVVEQGAPAYRLIAEAFGSGILHEDGSIDREKLGSIIFQHAKEREKLNSIVHPAVRKEMLRQKKRRKQAARLRSSWIFRFCLKAS